VYTIPLDLRMNRDKEKWEICLRPATDEEIRAAEKELMTAEKDQ